MLLFYMQSHRNRHVVLAATFCVIISLHTHFWLHTCLPRITHILLSWTVLFSCLNANRSSEWTVWCTSHTPWSGWPFLLCCLITNNSSEWTVCCTSHTLSSGCPFLLFRLIANSLSEWTVCRISHTPPSGYPFLLFCLITNSSFNWTVCPASHMQLKSKSCLMHPSSQMFCTFLTVFYTIVCDYCIAHIFVEGSLIVVSH